MAEDGGRRNGGCALWGELGTRGMLGYGECDVLVVLVCEADGVVTRLCTAELGDACDRGRRTPCDPVHSAAWAQGRWQVGPLLCLCTSELCSSSSLHSPLVVAFPPATAATSREAIATQHAISTALSSQASLWRPVCASIPTVTSPLSSVLSHVRARPRAVRRLHPRLPLPPLRDKLLQLSDLSRGFHSLTPACFRCDALLLTPELLDEVQREGWQSSRSCDAVSLVRRVQALSSEESIPLHVQGFVDLLASHLSSYLCSHPPPLFPHLLSLSLERRLWV